MDQHIFDQLDMLERGARDIRTTHAPYHDSSTEYSAHDAHGAQYIDEYDEPYSQVPPDDYVDQSMQLDSFGEQ